MKACQLAGYEPDNSRVQRTPIASRYGTDDTPIERALLSCSNVSLESIAPSSGSFQRVGHRTGPGRQLPDIDPQRACMARRPVARHVILERCLPFHPPSLVLLHNRFILQRIAQPVEQIARRGVHVTLQAVVRGHADEVVGAQNQRTKPVNLP